MGKIGEVVKKNREILMYLIFGVLTTVVSFAVYFAVLRAGSALLPDDAGEGALWWVRTAAQVLQWIAGVLFAFFTNKKYVFLDENRERSHVWRKLAEFSASRVATLLLDTGITFGAVALLTAVGYRAVELSLGAFTLNISADFIAKVLAAVFVIVGNYVLSKVFVFRRGR